jgi:hypothetical protein
MLIKRIVRKFKVGDHPITEVELTHGGRATGYGHDWSENEKVNEIYDQQYNKVKIIKLLDKVPPKE